MKLDSPLQAIQEGHWFKLICGASFQYLPQIRNLTLAYALAGANCIDLAPDPAVLAVAQEALEIFDHLHLHTGARPWLMVSFNDGEDPHFRKATFDPQACPTDCSRPCVSLCPTQAIQFPATGEQGVEGRRCYGCGRCIPVCPLGHIIAQSHISAPTNLMPQFIQMGLDAVELHTQIGRLPAFLKLWQEILPWLHYLKAIAISCSDGEGAVEYLWSIYQAIVHGTGYANAPLPCPLIWQADGRSMSGDIGAGTTHATIRFAQKLLTQGPPGYIQLAGGTNDYTVTKLRSLGLLRPPFSSGDAAPWQGQTWVAGVAYGSYARKWLAPILDTVPMGLEEVPVALGQAIDRAKALIAPLKDPVVIQST